MEIQSIFWLGLFVILLIIELATMGLTTIWFAGGSVAGFIISILNGSIVIQGIAFIIVSIILLVFTRPFAIQYVNKNRAKTNVEGIIGKSAVVIEAIDNLQELGHASLNGLEWMARTQDDQIRIEKGKTVEVVKVSGVKLIVKEKES